jgi:phage terminase large subunit
MYYKSEPNMEDVINLIKEDGNRRVICDSAEPRSIADLIKQGLNAQRARKGADSIKTGIRRLQAKNIFVHEDSKDVITELNNYKWKIDLRTDIITDVTVDNYNHALDAVRYIVNTFEI